MTLSGFQALCVLAVMCALFLRFGCVRESSPSRRHSDGLQGDAPGVPGPGGDRPERVS
jgi:hypothetical protein